MNASLDDILVAISVSTRFIVEDGFHLTQLMPPLVVHLSLVPL